MVAYSFKKQFEVAIVAGAKRQTVRADRKRHARPGEALQLYTGMRTKSCRKLLTPDPICLDVRPVEIEFDTAHPSLISKIEVDGFALAKSEAFAFAMLDGFGSSSGALRRMGEFWLANHGAEPFSGVVIRWRPTS
tara:strand:+ start:1481 stop:1885 length:405 start_codon:yes stop_codon:yes gene_type:complete